MPREHEPTPAPGPSPFARGPTGLSGKVTAILAITLLGLLFVTSMALPMLGGATAHERGPETVTRVFERRLELTAALEQLPEWERTVLAPFLPVDVRTADEAVQAFREVIDNGHRGREEATAEERAAYEAELDGLRARRAVMLAEFRRTEEAQGDLAELAHNGHQDFVAAVRALSIERARVEDLALVGDGWIGQVALARASGNAPPTPGSAVQRALTWARAFASCSALGLVVLLGWLLRNRPDITAGTIAIPSPWTPQTGFAVLVRAAFFAILIYVALAGLQVVTHTDLPFVLGALAASLPLFFLVRNHLARPHRLAMTDIIGFPAMRANVLLSAVALFALVQVGGRAIATAASASGAVEPWTFQINEFAIWSSDATLAFGVLDSLIFGVVGVEIAFRGVLFPSLRHVHGPIHSALLAGMLYSAVHFAALPTMLALGWTGLVAALAVERTRSLLPAILCAATGEILEIGLASALYR